MRRAIAAAIGGVLALAGGPAAVAGAAPVTGRLLVTLAPPPAGTAQASAAAAVAASAGARRTDLRIPQLGVVGVRARPGASLHALAQRLRRDPRVRSVRAERRYRLRWVPDDPALTAPDLGEPGTTSEWWAAREDLFSAWDVTRGDGARVAVIDTGVDATHPDLAGRIVATADFDDRPGDGPPTVDEVGHGTHVASLACAQPDNGIGLAGAGGGCGLLVAKSDLSEGSVARAIVWAADHGADAITMSFGTDGRVPAAGAVVAALRYAAARGAVPVAAAADDPVTEQGDPANVLQPTGTGPELGSGLGLSVTAATAGDTRAAFAGHGTQISLAAYGTYGNGGANGILGAFPAGHATLEDGGPQHKPCRCRTTFGGDDRYAYLPGTSMAAPMVAGVAALMRHLNPDLPVAEVVRILEQTAHRPAGIGWTPDLGWGIVDAGAAVAAARVVDLHPPTSHLRRPAVRGRRILLRWRARDPAPPNVAASGVARFEVWRSVAGRQARRIAVTRRRSLRLRGVRGRRYAFFTIAVDHAGNREAPPAHADARVRVARRGAGRLSARRRALAGPSR